MAAAGAILGAGSIAGLALYVHPEAIDSMVEAIKEKLPHFTDADAREAVRGGYLLGAASSLMKAREENAPPEFDVEKAAPPLSSRSREDHHPHH